MKRIAIVTDSNSGITQEEANQLGVFVLPMPFYIDDVLYFEEITLSQEEFYQHLEADADISTSQPAPGYGENSETNDYLSGGSDKVNPETGADDLVGLMASLAVLSLVGGVALSRKRK